MLRTLGCGVIFSLVNESLDPKRLLLGKRLSTKKLEGELLPKTIALPIFSSDPLSSVAYGPQEMLMILALGGFSFLSFTPAIASVVVLLLTIVVLSYRKVIAAYPSGGGDYEVAKKNLGEKPAIVVASALLIDYVLTVAVSIAAGTDNIISAFPELDPFRVEIAVGFIILLCAVNLRGVRESGIAFALPTYLFIGTVFLMIGTGIFKLLTNQPIVAPSAGYEVVAIENVSNSMLVLFLLLRAFASGSAALTGVEAIANGVPAFREPKIKNARTTMALMGTIAISMFVGIISFGLISQVHYLEDPLAQIGRELDGPQQSVIAQLGVAIFGDGSILFYILQIATAAVLLLAANTAFNGFPLLSSVLAKDKYAPKALLTRGDRLVYSNGMLSLTLAALALELIYQADVSALIQLYVLGVFTSFTIGWIAMLLHWKRGRQDGSVTKREALSGTLINGIGATMTASVLVIVTVTKFTHGAWLVFLLMPVLFWVMYNTARYYKAIDDEIKLDGTQFGSDGDYAVVLMDKLNKPQLKALDYAISVNHNKLDVIHIAADPARAEAFKKEWKDYGMKIPLKIIESPYREFSTPLIEYLENHRSRYGRERIAVYMPKYIVGHWWEHIFHNHRANRIMRRLMYVPGTMLVTVPWRMRSAEKFNPFLRAPLPGDSRRGVPNRPQPRRHARGRNAVFVIEAKDDDVE